MSKVRFEKLQEDVRGKVFRLFTQDREYMLFATEKGFRRGGETHRANQYLIVLEGKVCVVTPKVKVTLEEGMSFVVGGGVPHYMESLEHSVCLEWKKTGKEDKHVYKPYRNLVEECLK